MPYNVPPLDAAEASARVDGLRQAAVGGSAPCSSFSGVSVIGTVRVGRARRVDVSPELNSYIDRHAQDRLSNASWCWCHGLGMDMD